MPYDFMSIEYLGLIMIGVEDTKSDEAKKWQGAIENYSLKSANGKTKLQIETDITEEYL